MRRLTLSSLSFAMLSALAAGQSAPPFYIYQPVLPTTVTNFFRNQGASPIATNLITRLVADDITPIPGFAGQDVYRVSALLVNQSTETINFRYRIRFYQANGTAAAGPTGVLSPGTLISGFSPATTSLTSQAIGYRGVNPAAGAFVVPNGTFWAGISFDNFNGATGANGAQLNALGVSLNPAITGSNTDTYFRTTNAGDFLAANPAGAQAQFTSGVQSQFAWLVSVQGQNYVGTITLGDVTAPIVPRTITLRVVAGGNTIATRSIAFGDTTTALSSVTLAEAGPFTPVVGPARLPIGATDLKLIVGGASFLDRVVPLTVPSPPSPSSASPALSFGVISLINGDVDQNGEVDLTDIDLVIADYLTAGGTTEGTITDLDANGEVDLTDIDVAIANYLQADELP